MNKKFLASTLVLGMLFGTPMPALAYDNGKVNLQDSVKKGKISPNTIITEDNIYDVLDYLNIDRSNFTKLNQPIAGQLKQVGDNFNRMNTEPIEINKDNFDNHDINREPPDDRVERGTRTKYSFTKRGSCELDISCTGDYERVISVWSSNNSSKCTREGSADVRINSSDCMTSQTIKLKVKT